MANRPYEVRSHITMDMKTEKKVFDSLISTLAMCEHGPDEQEVQVVLTLGELRQHVQWCQYAGQLCDGAEQMQRDYQRLYVRHLETERRLKRMEHK